MHKDNITKHKEYQKLARCVYKEHKNKCPKDWIEFNYQEDKNGFRAAAYYKNNEIVIAISGTDEPNDWLNSNFKMGLKHFPDQYEDTYKFFKKIKKITLIQKSLLLDIL